MDKVLEDFGKWVDSLTYSELDDLCERSAFKVWQASRKAIKVELPSHVNDTDSAPMLYDSITEQLTAAGISYE